MEKKPCTTCEKLANSSFLMVTSRIGIIMVGMMSIWIVNSVSDMKGDVRTILASMEGQATRLANLEDWRNTFSSLAEPTGEQIRHVRKN